MPLKVDIDHKTVNRLFKANIKHFGSNVDIYGVEHLRHELADYIYKVRVQTLVMTGMPEADAVKVIDNLLEKTESSELI